MVRTSLLFLAIALGCLAFADLEVTTVNPWQEMGRLGLGLLTPDFFATDRLLESLLNTLAFALLGVALANVFGFALALLFHYRIVRMGCAFVRAIHELFWALIFLQIFGLHPLTGILAIGIPFAGIVAKVYAEILEEMDPVPLQVLPAGSGVVSSFFYARIPQAWAHLKTYGLYRLECALRSSAILGFIGLPTLGFHLESAFSQGHYSEVSALLILFYIMIGTIRWWMRSWLIPIYLLGAAYLLSGTHVEIYFDTVLRFVTQDIVPHPIRVAHSLDWATLTHLYDWAKSLFVNQAWPGIINTLLVTMISLVASGILTLLFFPLISPKFFGRWGQSLGHVFLVVLRSTPEYILAYIGLQLLGPSMLPAILALALHNGAIIGHLIGRYTEPLALRPDSPHGIDLYAYEILPRVYPQFLAFLFYRWEVILRETAILGILGIHTLGFFVDSAFADIRFDRALLLIFITAMLNMLVDGVSRRIRAGLRLNTTPEET